MLVLVCSKDIRRRYPINYALLTALTICEAFSISAFTALYTPESVLLAIGVLAATVVSLFVTALVTPVSERLLKFLAIGLILSLVL